MQRSKMLVGIVLIVFTVASIGASQNKKKEGRKEDGAPRKAAVNRARETVKMLDDVYKNAVVLITDKYVNDEDDFPAGSAAIELFSRISKKGWHVVELLDATGEPYDPDNVASDDFEKKGIAELKGGKDYYEEVQKKDGAWVLRAVTPIPVVMQKCTMCHENYKKAKKGEPIGVLAYEIPIK